MGTAPFMCLAKKLACAQDGFVTRRGKCQDSSGTVFAVEINKMLGSWLCCSTVPSRAVAGKGIAVSLREIREAREPIGT